jgi:glycosyltransferase involved in cell wall biosynthesis
VTAKFSVLLPTRNGGSFLAACIESILNQDFDDLELVISDNANVDETPDVIRKFAGDKRMVCVRQDEVLSVTANWNKALAASSGQYILMMGDDDYLMPGYFSRVAEVIRQYEQPDCVLYNAFSFVAPHSINGNKQSFYRTTHFPYGKDLSNEMVLSSAHRLSIVRQMFRFEARIPLNMQTTLMSRPAIQRVSGPIFRPPFPDHYALNALLLTAPRWVFLPEKLVVIGISPKSFGHYVYSNQQAGGLAYLGIERDLAGMLPGSELVNGSYVWLNLLKANFPEQLNGQAIDRPSYVRRQVLAWCRQLGAGVITLGEFWHRLCELSLRDWLGVLQTAWDKASWERVLRPIIAAGGSKREPLRPLTNVSTISDFAKWLAGNTLERSQ